VATAWLGLEASWTDVDIDTVGAPWYDIGCFAPYTDPPTGEHYFWGSKLVGHKTLGFYSQCHQSWFYGSEIRVQLDNPPDNPVRGVVVSGRGDVRMFGSTVRAFIGAVGPTDVDGVGVQVGFVAPGDDHGKFHFHGGIISVDASKGTDAVGMHVDTGPSGSSAGHVVDTAWTLIGGTGEVRRLKGNNAKAAPFLWPRGTDEPIAGLLSRTGADLYVETDCGDASGGCDGGSEPHLMVYSAQCPSRWFGQVLGECKD
jgi:hypothetical protein